MKESIGGTWLFGLVIAFVVMFTTFVSVSTNYSRCFKIKDDILAIIEYYHGVNDRSISAINEMIVSIGYSSTGDCPTDDGGCWFGFNSGELNARYSATDVNYCIAKNVITKKVQKNTDGGGRFSSAVIDGAIGHPESAYYQVIVFFRLDWPILNQIMNINIDGETSVIFLLDDYWQIENLCG